LQETRTLASSARRGFGREHWNASTLLAALGFLLAALLGAGLISRQLALIRAQNYLRDRYGVNLDVPVTDARPAFLTRTPRLGPAPPLGFCWGVELRAGGISADVFLNPWNHQILDVDLDR